MTDPRNRPVPLINPQLCDGCGLCVRICPTATLELKEGKAVVAHPLRCDYYGYCEAVCPVGAISRPFEILLADPESDEKESASNSTKVVLEE